MNAARLFVLAVILGLIAVAGRWLLSTGAQPAWSTPANISMNAATSAGPSIAAAADGTLHALWHDGKRKRAPIPQELYFDIRQQALSAILAPTASEDRPSAAQAQAQSPAAI